VRRIFSLYSVLFLLSALFAEVQQDSYFDDSCNCSVCCPEQHEEREQISEESCPCECVEETYAAEEPCAEPCQEPCSSECVEETYAVEEPCAEPCQEPCPCECVEETYAVEEPCSEPCQEPCPCECVEETYAVEEPCSEPCQEPCPCECVEESYAVEEPCEEEYIEEPAEEEMYAVEEPCEEVEKGPVCCDHYRDPRPCCTPAIPCPMKRGIDGEVYVAADFLWWRAENHGYSYAFNRTENSWVQGKVMRVNPSWDPGFRLALGWNAGYDQWDILAAWTWYYNKAKTLQTEFAATGNLGYYPQWPVA
jgi:hypothetical protein